MLDESTPSNSSDDQNSEKEESEKEDEDESMRICRPGKKLGIVMRETIGQGSFGKVKAADVEIQRAEIDPNTG